MNVRIGPINYEVQEVADLTTTEHGETRALAGQILYQDCLIKVDPSLPAQIRPADLWHEVVHGILYQAGHIHHPEEMVVALGYGLMQVIRDNPDLIALTVKGSA